MVMRSFIAIDINDRAIVDSIKKLQSDLESLNINLKMINPENIHITLQFLGDLKNSEINILKRILSSVTFESFSCTLLKLGTFPNMNKISVIWIGIDSESSGKLLSLYDDIDKKIIDLNFQIKRNFFSPHVTIARLKDDKNKEKLQNYINENKGMNIGSQIIDNFKLKSSLLTSGGPIYEDISVYNVDLK